MKPRRPASMTAAKRAALEADSIASSPPTSLTALFGGAYRLLDSVAMAAPCVGGVHMITRWGEAAATDLRSCARLHTPPDAQACSIGPRSPNPWEWRFGRPAFIVRAAIAAASGLFLRDIDDSPDCANR